MEIMEDADYKAFRDNIIDTLSGFDINGININTVEKALRKKTEIPKSIETLLKAQKKKISIEADYDKFKELFMNRMNILIK